MRDNQISDTGKILSIEKSAFKDLVDVVYNHDRRDSGHKNFAWENRRKSIVAESSSGSPVPKSLRNIDMKNLKNVDRRSSQDSTLNEKLLETVKESKSSNSEAGTVESSSKSTTL